MPLRVLSAWEEGFRAAQHLSVTKLQCWCPLVPRLPSQKEDHRCPQRWLRFRAVLETAVIAHEPRGQVSFTYALAFVAVGIISFVFLQQILMARF